MKTMKSMQEYQLSKCFKKNGWPRPFVHFGGAVEIVKNQKDFDRILKQEILMIATAPFAAFAIIGLIYGLRVLFS